MTKSLTIIVFILMCFSCSTQETKPKKDLIFNNKQSGNQACGYDNFHPESDKIEEYSAKAKNGDINAQLEMSAIYFGEKDNFSPEKINKKEAIKWVKMAADNGSAKGAYILASRYSTGDCLELDNIMAKYYIDKAVKLYEQDNDEEMLKKTKAYQKWIDEKLK